MTSICDSLNSNYYAIVTDMTRTYAKDREDTIIDKLIAMILAFDYAVIPILVVLILIIVILPIVALVMDKRDYDAIQGDTYEIDDSLIKKVAMKKNEAYL